MLDQICIHLKYEFEYTVLEGQLFLSLTFTGAHTPACSSDPASDKGTPAHLTHTAVAAYFWNKSLLTPTFPSAWKTKLRYEV